MCLHNQAKGDKNSLAMRASVLEYTPGSLARPFGALGPVGLGAKPDRLARLVHYRSVAPHNKRLVEETKLWKMREKQRKSTTSLVAK